MIARTLLLLSLTVSAGLLAAPAAASPAKPAGPAASSASPALQAVITSARADAARRSGLPAGRIRVRQAEQLTWPDGSLGCPQPGEMYTQALVPGYRIQLDAGTQRYDYHADTHGTLRLCPAGSATGKPVAPATSRRPDLIEAHA